MAKINLSDLSKYLEGATLYKYRTALTQSNQQWANQLKDELKINITDIIKRGQSPVKGGQGQTGGQARFVGYSPSYTKQINDGRYDSLGKKLRPINLTLTGQMLRSIKATVIPDGLRIWFSSPIAKYHTLLGAGRSRVKRKMLPVDPGDEFTRLINKGLVDKFKSILVNNLNKG